MSISVEILVRAPMETLWRHTQTPAFHERWDLRFSRIEYLPRRSDTEPQRFRYATRIGFGMEVAGDGETVGERDRLDGSRSSALKCGSDSRLSIIREGSGYWKYRLRDVSGARIGLPAARWMLEIGALFMRTETELILKSRRVVPARLLERGFTFRFPLWQDAARDLFQRRRFGELAIS